MKNSKSSKIILSWVFQIVAAIILAKAAYSKFTGSEMSVSMFQALGIDQTRLIIAAIEAIAALLLLTKNLSQYGALLGLGTMMGALIAHATVLGFDVNNDGGMMVILMSIVVVSAMIIMWIRRKTMPFIGHTCD